MNSVSVVIPAHNSSATLIEAIESVVQQTHPVLEVIVVDDASTDNTVDLFKTWQQAHTSSVPTKLVCQRHNTGPAGARNVGIQAATGDWVAFLDGDDAWLPGKIEAQLNTADTHPHAVMLCGGTLPLAPHHTASQSPAFRVNKLPLTDFIIHNPVATSTVMVWRKALLDAGLFDEQFRGPEDYDLWMRIASHHECLELKIPLARYRTTTGSLSMDERTFLPQVIAVMNKAFGSGGALAAHSERRRRAFAEQYSSASWMAFNRGDRRRALRHLMHSWFCSLSPIHKERTEDRLLRLKLLFLYLGIKRRPVNAPNENTRSSI